jgi:hypothetical protein
MEVLWGSRPVTSSRPYGTVRHSNPSPGLRPGLSSAVPVRQAQGRLCGTHFAIGRFSRTLWYPAVGAREHTPIY